MKSAVFRNNVLRSQLACASLMGAFFFLISLFAWTDSKHFIAGGDIFYPLDQRLILSKASSTWWPDQLGARSYNVSSYAVRVLLLLLQICGLSAIDIERVFLASGFGLSAAAMYLLTGRIWRTSGAPVIAALWYVGGIFYSLCVPNENNVVAFALTPLIAYFAIKANDSVLSFVAVCFTSLLLGIIGANPPTLVLVALIVGLLWFAVSATRYKVGPLITHALMLVFGVLAINFWWLDATFAAITGSKVVAASVGDWSWVLSRSDLVSVAEEISFWGFGFASEPWLTLGQWYLHQPVAHVALLATPVLALCSVGLVRTGVIGKRIKLFAIAAVVAIILGKGLHPPFSALNAFLYAHMPLMFLYREPVKFALVLAVLYPLLASAAFSALWRVRDRILSTVAIVLFVTVPIVTGWSLFTGRAFALGGLQKRIEIPAYWFTAISFINRVNDGRHQVLLLPEDAFYQARYQWGLEGVDHIAESSIYAPIIRLVADQQSYLANHYSAEALRMLQQSIDQQDPIRVSNLLRRMAIRFILVRSDLVPDGRVSSPRQVEYVLEQAGATRVRRFGPLSIYQVDNPPDVLASTREVLRSCAPPDAELKAAAKLRTSISIVRSDTRRCHADPESLQSVPAGVKINAAPGDIVIRSQPERYTVRWVPVHGSVTVPQRFMVDVQAAVSGPTPLSTPNGARWHGPWSSAMIFGRKAHVRLVEIRDARVLAIKDHSKQSRIMIYWPSVTTGCDSIKLPKKIRLWRYRFALDVPSTSKCIVLVTYGKPFFDLATTLTDVTAYRSVPPRAPAKGWIFNEALRRDSWVRGMPPGQYEFIFRMPTGYVLSAFYEQPSRNEAVNVHSVFESAAQVLEHVRAMRPYSMHAVQFESVVPWYSRASVPLSIEQRSEATWDIETVTSRREFVAVNQTFVGHPRHIFAHIADLRLSRWWNSSQLLISSPGWVLLRESYDDAWNASGERQHGVADGFANAFYLDKGWHSIGLSTDSRLHVDVALSFALSAIAVAAAWALRRQN